MKSISVSILIFLASQAQAARVGERVLCGLWQGQIQEIFDGSTAFVEFDTSYESALPSNARKLIEPIDLNECHYSLGSGRVSHNGIRQGDEVLCGFQRGEALEVFRAFSSAQDLLVVRFTGSFLSGRHEPMAETSVIEAGQCRRKRN